MMIKKMMKRMIIGLDNINNKVYITVIIRKFPFIVDNPVNSGV